MGKEKAVLLPRIGIAIGADHSARTLTDSHQPSEICRSALVRDQQSGKICGEFNQGTKVNHGRTLPVSVSRRPVITAYALRPAAAFGGQQCQTLTPVGEYILPGRGGQKGGADVPRNIKLMRSAALSQITYQTKISLFVKHPPAVNDWRRQPGISVVTALKQIKLPAGDPLLDVDPGGIPPREGTRAVSLIASIDLHGVMGAGATQASALAAVANVFERPRIH